MEEVGYIGDWVLVIQIPCVNLRVVGRVTLGIWVLAMQGDLYRQKGGCR